MLGSTVREAGGIEAWLASLCPDDDHRNRVIDSFREHVWRNQLTRTFSLRSLKGKLREVELRSSLHRDGGITIVLQDVTESIRAQEAQRHGKLKFRTLFAGTENGAVLADRTGRIIDANPAFLEFVSLSLREIRMSAFSELLHPEDSGCLQSAESKFLKSDGSGDFPPLEVRIRAQKGEKTTKLSFHPIGEIFGDPSMSLYLTSKSGGGNEALLTERLQLVARKAKSLLDAVPDLIFLIDDDLTIADFAPPSQAWKELEMLDSWRGQRVTQIWPALGELLSGPKRESLAAGKILHADLLSQQEDAVQFAVTLSSAGDGQILAVIRNESGLRQAREKELQLSRAFDFTRRPAVIANGDGRILHANAAVKRLARDTGNNLVGSPLTALLDETSCMLLAQHLPTGQKSGKSSAFQGTIKRRNASPLETTLEICSLTDAGEPVTFAVLICETEEGPMGLEDEQSQHHFRNQLQMVTSLFSIESHDAMNDESLIKWQLRLRSLACAIPTKAPLHLGFLIRQVSNEATRLLQLGPSERFIFLNGPENLELDRDRVTAMALLVGELIRLVTAYRKQRSNPRLQFSFTASNSGGFILEFLAENLKHSDFPKTETETIELLITQMGGRMSDTGNDSHRGWSFDLSH
ncbi:MAG: PAS domain-containing protein [Verrucomicrobiales bacterium]|nr:PAS domain-containing protein [Verrucomicrobiales bacterium]